MHFAKSIAAFVVILASLGVAVPAAAYVPPVIDIAGPMSNTILNRNLLDERLEERDAEERPQLQRSTEAERRDAFRYAVDEARTRSNLQRYIARTANPAARAELDRLIASQPRIMADIRDGLRLYGLDGTSVADAFAVWWMNSWLASRQRNDDPPRQTIRAVQRQVRDAFAITPGLAEAGDAERQEYAEGLLLQAAILGSVADAAESDPRLRARLADVALQSAAQQGLDLASMELTEQGFIPL